MIENASRWISEGLEFLQLREKDLPASELAKLSRNLLQVIGLEGSPTKLIVNSRPDVALATKAHGVHLSSSEDALTPDQVRRLYDAAKRLPPLITMSCHTVADVERAHRNQVTAILFAPVFQKPIAGSSSLPGRGLEALHAACLAAQGIPVYALGGVTLQNAESCLGVGAAGVAGIRLFHSGTS